MRRDFIKALRELWRAFEDAFDPYRPERHYMRGPGPKCRAKRAGIAANPAPAADGGAEFAKIPT